jgi:MFS family permease
MNNNQAKDSASQATVVPLTAPLPGARLALSMLLAINMFNYIDRYVLSPVLPIIRDELLPGDPDANFKVGSLQTAFLVTYMILAPLFGWLADRMSRWWLIGIGFILWSLASGGSGLASAFIFLFLTRCLVGVGEAAYAPVAPTLIADFYPVKIRGRVLAWFYSAIPVGSALGFALGGTVSGIPSLGWRWAFYLIVPPGLILGLLCFFMREPTRGQADEGAVTGKRRTRLEDYVVLLKTPSWVLVTLGMTAMTFGQGGLAIWMPDYLKNERGISGVGPFESSTVFGGILVVAGFSATLAGGFAGDWLKPRFAGSYFLISAISLTLGFPTVLLVLWTPFPYCWFFIFLAIFLAFFNTGPTNTILANVTHPAVRASGFAINIFVIHLLGDAISPPIIGFIRDHTATKELRWGFVLVSAMFLAGGMIWLLGTRYLEKDTRLAPTRLN